VKRNALFDAPIIIANKETLLLMFVVITVIQNKFVQLKELGIAVNEYLSDEVFLLLAE
jgi:hypothetical protein